jgi:uncharacterized membrane protein YbhN (UPF0104 family)
MGVVFALILGVLVWTARAPDRVAAALRRLGLERRLGAPPVARALEIIERLATAIRPLGRRAQGLPFLLWSAAYWGITVVQLWAVLHACGLELELAAAATIVAVVGLSIQLPGGPAQLGSFQAGTALALGLFLEPAQLAESGSSFAALMYLLGLLGAVAMAIPGAWLLARSPKRPPVPTTAR